MEYTANKLAKLAGVSVRTLHYYDQIGLLTPVRVKSNGYRKYREKDLVRLQQILFFRELDFPLDRISEILKAPGFKVADALKDQETLLKLKRSRLDELIRTLNCTMKNLQKGGDMDTKKIFDGFSMDKIDKYRDEVIKKWGDTPAYAQSVERTKNWTKDDYRRIEVDSHAITAAFSELMDRGIADPEVQKLVERHHRFIGQFYDCPLEMYRALGVMYVTDERFAKTYNDVKPGLAVFVRDAIGFYCNSHSGK